VITREPVETAPPTVEYRVGTWVLQGVPLSAVPREFAVEVPAVRTYKYLMVNDRAGPPFFSASNLP
jgi:hypothetical protein